MTGELLYDVRNATRSFRRGDATINALDGIDLTIEQGEIVALVGPSGSGKTTLLQLLGALDRSTSGQVFFEGRDLNTLADNDLADLRLRAFGFVFQTFNLIPTLNALQNVEAKMAPTGLPDSEMRSRSLALLQEVGLSDRAHHLPSQLSGGEQQRVAIARALSTEPRVVLADEPTGNLDSRTGMEVVDLLTSLSEERGHTVILVTHDVEIAEKAHRSIRMQDGRLLEPTPA
ncbi:MAG TPA: ABC transporter ATP-binding protein [Gaiellaceae bacterium]|nr:ABC transporter ATP-binding protein [Gaiellaceae bacterium]